MENPTDRGAWWAIVHGITKELDMTEQLNNYNKEEVSKENKVGNKGGARSWRSSR